MEEAQVYKPPANCSNKKAFGSGLRVCGANLPLRERPVRMDVGWGLLLEMRASGASLLPRTMGSSRVCTETRLYVYSNLQAVTCLQALGACIDDFLPIEVRINVVLKWFSAALD
jgi:hypothetical protein